uniref:Uncharacterized protein n=1 Tax=Anguilla anguilla TaxID=7936 RepID=A0A0E9PJW5_ANGAN
MTAHTETSNVKAVGQAWTYGKGLYLLSHSGALQVIYFLNMFLCCTSSSGQSS